MIDFTLSPEQKQTREDAGKFANLVLKDAYASYSKYNTNHERFQATEPIVRKAAEMGLLKSAIPAALGGTGGSLIDVCLVVEELYAVEPSVALTILANALGLYPLVAGGTSRQHQKFLAPFLNGQDPALASLVYSEPGGTANFFEPGASGMQTTARKEGNMWILSGEKRNASDAYTIVKHLDTPGHTACSGPHIKFHGLRVPEYHVLAGPGTMNAYRLVQAAFTMSAVIVGAMSVGIMRHAFETALDFAKSRTAGSTVLLLERQSVADSLIDIKMSVEAARCITWKAAHALEHMGEAENSYEAKIWCSEAAVEVVTKAMRVVGISSYDTSFPVARMLSDALALPIFDGGNVGIRRRQLQKLFLADDYDPWRAAFGKA
ncbi:hypothetical protein H2199_002340 [Coniosporium tulheliwenetii]|uniref:Uncharacterized protein n=1 Tax=Coniosporium tulheliwenetii TaxID=3383036 RepID=A0ACC2ZIM3_9PEZI|nr:hypothetical protein H2199_002340 [Cladosporium sp. JES 115]